jgi:hypothetical protein
LIKNQHVHAQIGGGGFGYDEDRVLTRRHLKPKAAQLTPNSSIRLDRVATAVHAHQGEQRGANARHTAHNRVERMRML